jgi:hypothetical protein
VVTTIQPEAEVARGTTSPPADVAATTAATAGAILQ